MTKYVFHFVLSFHSFSTRICIELKRNDAKKKVRFFSHYAFVLHSDFCYTFGSHKEQKLIRMVNLNFITLDATMQSKCSTLFPRFFSNLILFDAAHKV